MYVAYVYALDEINFHFTSQDLFFISHWYSHVDAMCIVVKCSLLDISFNNVTSNSNIPLLCFIHTGKQIEILCTYIILI